MLNNKAEQWNYDKPFFQSEYPRRQPSQPRPDTRAVDALSKEIDRLKRQNRELLEHEKVS